MTRLVSTYTKTCITHSISSLQGDAMINQTGSTVGQLSRQGVWLHITVSIAICKQGLYHPNIVHLQKKAIKCFTIQLPPYTITVHKLPTPSPQKDRMHTINLHYYTSTFVKKDEHCSCTSMHTMLNRACSQHFLSSSLVFQPHPHGSLVSPPEREQSIFM